MVEDEKDLIDLLSYNLSREGYSVDIASTGGAALERIRERKPDLVLLDLMLPDVPGTDICRRVKGDPLTSHIPVVMVTARAEEIDRIVGFELGADDYVTKPFSPREVVLRVQAILRRAATSVDDLRGPVSFGGGHLVIDSAHHEVTVAGRAVGLTPTEWGLLATLAASAGRVYSRTELLNRVRGYEFGSERAVDSHIKNLRRKIEEDPGDPRLVVTVLGVGYRLGLTRDP